MTAALFDGIRRIAAHEAASRPVASLGVVQDVHAGTGAPPDHSVSLTLRDSGLVLTRVPVAVGALGQSTLPSPGDLVIVVFCEGDLHEPVVVGRLYPVDVDPPPYDETTLALELPPGSGSSAAFSLTVTDAPLLDLRYPDSDVEVKVADSLVSASVGDFHVTVDGSGSGQVEIAGGGSTITLDGSGNVTISAQAKLTLSGADVEISASGQVKVSGSTVGLN